MREMAGRQGQRGVGERRLKTRDRILQTACKLFNEQGEAHVTLAHIGEYLGMSEGNVWYHFHTRHDLIMALFAEMKGHVKTNQQRDLSGLRQLSDVRDMFVESFLLMWKYRFLFQDHIDLMVTLPEVRGQIVELTLQGHNFVVRVLQRLCEIGLLQVEKSEMEALATNIWIINRYWIDYCQTSSEKQQVTEQDFQKGMQQIRMLLLPYFTPTGHHLIEEGGK